MVYRDIIKELQKWSEKDIRKPLIIRGARQVGKTTVVDIFAEQFHQYIYLNLEEAGDRSLFEKNTRIDDLGKVIPIEVKSGATGRLRSLHAFMDRSDQDIAIRYYAGELRVETIKTLNNKTYRLLNIPYFLASQTEGYLDWVQTIG